MSLLVRMRRQTCVFWPVGDTDGLDEDAHGNPAYGTPVEVPCRWDETTVEYLSKDGTKEVSNCQVFVDRDMAVGGLLMLGTLDDIQDSENPMLNDGVHEIKSFQKTPNLKVSEYLRICLL
jgi:hypothetical protein